MKYIDIHCHLGSPEYDSDRPEVLARMQEQEAGAITIGTSLEESKKAVEIAEQNENIWACIGVHPQYATGNEGAEPPSLKIREGLGDELLNLAKHPKVVAIGECGLDYFRLESHSAKAAQDKQKSLFEQQIELALKYNKPLMLHIREAGTNGSSGRAYEDALEILNSYKKVHGDKLRGNVHFFAGNVETARKFLDLDFTLSFTGVVTFTHDYDEAVRYVPQDAIMSETDAPWVAPVPHRGERNEPALVLEVVRRLAEIRGESLDDLSRAVLENARRLFGVA